LIEPSVLLDRYQLDLTFLNEHWLKPLGRFSYALGCPRYNALAGKSSTRLLTIRQENLMSDLVAIVYPSEAKAEEVRQRLFDLRKQYLIEFSDAVIAVKTDAGPVKLNQLVNTTAGNRSCLGAAGRQSFAARCCIGARADTTRMSRIAAPVTRPTW
jgi:hypothetical protein